MILRAFPPLDSGWYRSPNSCRFVTKQKPVNRIISYVNGADTRKMAGWGAHCVRANNSAAFKLATITFAAENISTRTSLLRRRWERCGTARAATNELPASTKEQERVSGRCLRRCRQLAINKSAGTCELCQIGRRSAHAALRRNRVTIRRKSLVGK